ncbi:hypothetical protein J2T12_002279 [Paenibacillus anaericanus]|uniref:hypothetical protein n=1 Tax=Paenibacillus anaericanus TaxID=170367 RepID=UPI00278AA97E|nr:hypothetical protein [Paenibacillus anaericanus]MDQ0088869.1 hypothetical protein [Paenibacillus anaericanus]
MINPAIEEGLTSLGLSVGGTGAQYSKKKQFGFNPNCFFTARKVSDDKNVVRFPTYIINWPECKLKIKH